MQSFVDEMGRPLLASCATIDRAAVGQELSSLADLQYVILQVSLVVALGWEIQEGFMLSLAVE